MATAFQFADALGPHKIIHVHEPSVGLKGTLVVDNVAAGPAIGGLRMAPDVSTEECFRLARAMTLKNAAAGLPHGGGKSVLYGDPRMPLDEKEPMIRAFAAALADTREYIFGPDMGTTETCMAWVRDEIGRCVGLPRAVGGIPLDEIGATGWGLRHSAEVALEFLGEALEGTKIAVQGFGAVGKWAARYLCREGAVLVAASDSRGAVHNPDGLDVDALIECKDSGTSVAEFDGGSAIVRDDLIGVDCDVWIPAARPDAINESNMEQLKARLVVPGANIPITAGAEAYLHDKGVVYIPDIIANAGGVICAAVEYGGRTEKAALETIEEKVQDNTRTVLEVARGHSWSTTRAARELALHRLNAAMSYRRWSLF